MLEHSVGGEFLGRVHERSNSRKAETYWIGFLSGIIASGRLEQAENFPLLVEAKYFLGLLSDCDAYDLVEDLSCSEAFSNDEILKMLATIVDVRVGNLAPMNSKDQRNFFLGQCAGVVCDNSVLTSEARLILATAKQLSDISDDPRILDFIQFVQNALKDDEINSEEQADFIAWVRSFVGECASDTGIATAESNAELPYSIRLSSEVYLGDAPFVVTGNFRLAPRKEIVRQLEALGGIHSSNVTKSTRYVFVASENSRDWKYNHSGGKILKALDYRNQGVEIYFVQETILQQILTAR